MTAIMICVFHIIITLTPSLPVAYLGEADQHVCEDQEQHAAGIFRPQGCSEAGLTPRYR